ncbi:hypothetical protein N7510_008315 [Penicillium lagena]|uniref:uncharacterized protein n=1 Tax=Penicillium lagena TaxID=94218 RepID=UPI002542516D|nr:uncharacterized protein N7510_008315 [Penicillium lagena]KAJ5605534.1 hypothetical protein N7510_008315 [Penicillium lagena]
MNTIDVSGNPQFVKDMTKQRSVFQADRSQKGQQPRGGKPRAELIVDFMFHLAISNNQPGFNLRTSFVPLAYPPCTSPVGDLKQIMIGDLLLETRHRGSYIILRTVTPPHRMTAIMAIVEDEQDNVVRFQMYHQDKTEKVLEEGTVMILKEPYLKVSATDGGYAIRVDHLSDVIYLPKHDERIPNCWQPRLVEIITSASKWKEVGNGYFYEAKFREALDCYSEALNCSPKVQEEQALRLNRALCFLKTSQFDSALAELKPMKSAALPTEKALLRHAQALYCLQKHRECCKTLTVIRKEYPENETAKDMFTRAIERVAEQEKGRYRFKLMQAEASKLRPPHLDHATYVGPVVIKPCDQGGRGLFTTQAVKAGDLLLCEKALAHAFIDEEPALGSVDITVLINAETNTVTMGGQTDLITMVIQKLHRNPSLAPVIKDLYHGSYKQSMFLTLMACRFLVERAVSYNCFGCCLSSREYHMRFELIIDNLDPDKAFHSCGLWPLASSMNHSCNSNADHSYIGDMMIVRASKNIPPNTEITLMYQTPSPDSNRELQKRLRHWGFQCNCVICKDFQSTKKSVLAKRKRLRNELYRCFKATDGMPRKRIDLPKIETIISAMTETYACPPTEVPRLFMWAPLLCLAQKYADTCQPAKAITAALKTFECLGYVIEGGKLPRKPGTPLVVKQWGYMADTLVQCWGILWRAYSVLAPELLAQVDQNARLTYRVCVGEDETYEQTYGTHTI